MLNATSYEQLAAAALDAALAIRGNMKDSARDLRPLKNFVEVLKLPRSDSDGYKFLDDARNSRIYLSAWSNSIGNSSRNITYDVVISNIKSIIHKAATNFNELTDEEKRQIASLCSAFSSAFISASSEKIYRNEISRGGTVGIN